MRDSCEIILEETTDIFNKAKKIDFILGKNKFGKKMKKEFHNLMIFEDKYSTNFKLCSKINVEKEKEKSNPDILTKSTVKIEDNGIKFENCTQSKKKVAKYVCNLRNNFDLKIVNDFDLGKCYDNMIKRVPICVNVFKTDQIKEFTGSMICKNTITITGEGYGERLTYLMRLSINLSSKGYKTLMVLPKEKTTLALIEPIYNEYKDYVECENIEMVVCNRGPISAKLIKSFEGVDCLMCLDSLMFGSAQILSEYSKMFQITILTSPNSHSIYNKKDRNKFDGWIFRMVEEVHELIGPCSDCLDVIVEINSRLIECEESEMCDFFYDDDQRNDEFYTEEINEEARKRKKKTSQEKWTDCDILECGNFTVHRHENLKQSRQCDQCGSFFEIVGEY